MQKCYGCGGTVRANLSVQPPSPWNIVLARREFRIYNKKGSDTINISAKKENVYYHPKMKCVEKRNDNVNANSIDIAEETKITLDGRHKALLEKEFGLKL
jgi:hypothetical protein